MSCSPRDQALLPPSSAEQGFVTARLGRRNSADLTPASGRQDHTISPSAISISRPPALRSLTDLSTRPAIHRAQNAAASTASRPYVRDDRDTPLSVGWDESRIMVFLPDREANYFCRRDSTGIGLTGKSAVHLDRPATRPATWSLFVSKGAPVSTFRPSPTACYSGGLFQLPVPEALRDWRCDRWS